MIALVIGTGRSGTTLVTEMIASHPDMSASEPIEERGFFKRAPETKYPENYVTKLTIDWFQLSEVEAMLTAREDIRIVWTMRDPRDIVLSKIRRGQPSSRGGDGSDRLADDATEEGLIADLERTQRTYEALMREFGERILLVKLEDVISDAQEQCGRIARHLFVDDCHVSTLAMLDGPAVMRDKYKQARYKGKLDSGQIALWRKLNVIYGGFFEDYDHEVLSGFMSSRIVTYMLWYYGYSHEIDERIKEQFENDSPYLC
ncbi:MAG: sulfotransferase [Gammaproteobacteria bacterium]|nr:sulfotransferase [Gammaproteobacteria bacterium]